MTPPDREEMMRRAAAKLGAMRERAKRQRRRVMTGATLAFIVLWLAIFTQMITGHDPALGPPTVSRSASAERAATDSAVRITDTDEGSHENDEEGEDRPTQVETAVTPVEEVSEEASLEGEELEPATTGQS
jgi:hypothetical protein